MNSLKGEKNEKKIKTHYNTVYNLLLASCLLAKVHPEFLGQ